MGRWTQRARELRARDEDSSDNTDDMREALAASPEAPLVPPPPAPAAEPEPTAPHHATTPRQPPSPWLPPFLTAPRQAVLDMVSILQAENGGALVSFADLEQHLDGTLSHTEIAAALSALVTAGYVTRYGRWQTSTWRYSLAGGSNASGSASTTDEAPLQSEGGDHHAGA